MKRTMKKLSKIQRKARSKRKTWTNAERFAVKHERDVAEKLLQAKAMKRWVKDMQAQIAANEAAQKASAETATDIPLLPETVEDGAVVLGDEGVSSVQEG
jgi:hypothetical protein